MKKNVFCSLLLVTMAGAIVSCGSGSTSSGATTETAATPISPPAGTTAVASTPVTISTANSTISVPGAGTYQTWSVPASLISDIVASGSEVQTQLGSAGVLMTTATALYWITPTIQSSVQKNTTNPGNVRAATTTVTASVSTISLTPTQLATVKALFSQQNSASKGNLVAYNVDLGYLFYADGLNITAVNAQNGAYFSINFSSINSSVCNFANSPVTSISGGLYNGNIFLGVGTQNGGVCLGNLGTGTPSPTVDSIVWTNMSSQAPTGRTPVNNTNVNYQPGPLNGLGFVSSSDGSASTPTSTYYGFWSVANPPAVYRISGTFNTETPPAPIPSSFWNITLNGIAQTQTSNTNNTFTATGAPTLTASTKFQTCTGAGGSLYVVFPTSGDSNSVQVYGFKGSSWGKTTATIPKAETAGFTVFPAPASVGTCDISSADGTTAVTIVNL